MKTILITLRARLFKDPSRSLHLFTSFCVCALLAANPHARAQTYAWSSLAGQAGGSGYADGARLDARFLTPQAATVDKLGNLYIFDQGNDVVRKITPDGTASTLAGNPHVRGYVDGNGSFAEFNGALGLVADSSGNVFVADSNNNAIRKVTPDGTVSTFAGGTQGSADGNGANAQFHTPIGLAFDASGNLYVADSGNATIRRIDSGGTVTTIAGLAGSTGTSDGAGSNARFTLPGGLAIDSNGDLIVADVEANTIRLVKLAPTVSVTTIAGNPGHSGSVDGKGSAALFFLPIAIAIDANDDIFVADFENFVIRKVTLGGVVTTFAGTAGKQGVTEGTGANARFGGLEGLAIDAGGNLYAADITSNIVWRITAAAVATIYGGEILRPGSANGFGAAAQFSAPQGLALDSKGNLYVADANNDTIRVITPDGDVSTLAGSPGSAGSADGMGSGARFNFPTAVAVDGNGTVYVADSGNNTIRKIRPDGLVSTVAGNPGQLGSADGVGADARFAVPEGVAVDAHGNLFVADTFNDTIREITPDGTVTTIAGVLGSNQPDADGAGTQAILQGPAGIVVDSQDNLYVADKSGGRIRIITPDHVVTTVAGSNSIGFRDGTNALFNGPVGIARDATGNLYVTDSFNNAIRMISPGGVVSTIGGQPGLSGPGVGPSLSVAFNGPIGIAALPDGTLFVANTKENVIVEGSTSSGPIARDDHFVLTSGSPIKIDVLANDFDPNGAPLTISAAGNPTVGRVKINGDNTLTYTPNLSFAKFSGVDTFTYTVSNGSGSATANVSIGNPIYLQKGNFAGTLGNPGGGNLTLALGATGVFTGKLRIGTTVYKLNGSFDDDGNYSTSLGGESLSLHLDLSQFSGAPDGAYRLSGSYNAVGFSAYHALYNSKTNPAPEAGVYTILLPAVQPAQSSVPSGTGCGLLTVNESGSVTIAGSLADGSLVSDGVFLTGSGTPFVNQIPVYESLRYTSPGSLTGTITFENVPGVSDCDGVLEWSKPAQTKGTLYPAGFNTSLSAVGSRYAPPPAATLALNFPSGSPNAKVVLGEPDFAQAIAKMVTVAIGSVSHTDSVTVTNPGLDKLAMVIKTNAATFSGSFIHPVTGKSVKILGVLSAKQNLAGGYFLSPTQSGVVAVSALGAP